MQTDGAVLDLVMEWEDRRTRGEAVGPEVVCAAVPHLAAEVRRLIGALAACDRLLALVPSAAVAPPPAPPPAPDRVGGYEIHGELGRGGMGVVYRAWDPALCRTVAVKTLRPAAPAPADDARRLAARFRREGQVLARLRHEAIVPVYESKVGADGPYFVMEYVAGGSLADHRDRLTAAGPTAAARFLERVTRAVAHAHAHGVLHRDLKPANILVDADGRPKVSDFGLAKLFESTDEPPAPAAGPDTATDVTATQLTVPGDRPGTWAYMAPEQFDPGFGPVGPAADVWALGVILYELLSGRRPFPGRTWADLRAQVCHGPPADPVTMPAGRRVGRRLERVVLRCLERDPGRRFRSAADLADALRRAAAPRRGWRMAAVAAMAVAGVAAAASGYRPPGESGWPDLPSVHDARARLKRGEEVVLIDGGPPAAYDLTMGPGSGKLIERDDGTVGVLGRGLTACLVELLPELPPGRFRLTAEVRHEVGAGEVGLYAAGTACRTPCGRQAFVAAINYADLGPPASPPRTPDDPGRRVATPGTILVGEDPRQAGRLSRRNLTAAKRHWDVVPDAGPPGWRRLSLDIDDGGVTVGWEGDRLGTMTQEFLTESRDAVCARLADLTAAALPVRTHGSIGIYVNRALAGVRRVSIRPLPPPAD